MNIEIKNLGVKVNKEILKDFNLEIKPGEVHALMGPNGVGKSTLSRVLMGYPDYKIVNGDIFIDKKSIKDLDISERSKLGIFLVYQNPISIDGVSTNELIKASINGQISLYEYIKNLEDNATNLMMDKQMLHRSFNVGFSGGERKKNEILQMLMLKPKFIILDELDSGLDVDSLKVVCTNINNYLNANKDTSVLIITHYVRILDLIKPDYVHMLKDGHIVQSGDYNLAKLIEKYGYNKSFDIEGNSSYE